MTNLASLRGSAVALLLFAFAACGGGTGSAGQGGGSCGDFADQTPPATFTITIQNGGSQPLYLGGSSGCGQPPLYELTDSTGATVAIDLGSCGKTCQMLQTQGMACPALCAMPPVVRIDPGGSYATAWSGTVYESANMPKSCYFEQSSASASCERRVLAGDGQYGVKVAAATSVTCNAGTCDCQPDASGSCTLSGPGTVGPATAHGQASFQLPSDSSVSVVVQ
jgi:hypothetical protein